MTFFPFEQKNYTIGKDGDLKKLIGRFVITSPNIKGGEGSLFAGQVYKDSFRIWHLMSRKNAFNPIITGEYTSTLELTVTMRLHPFVTAFLLIGYFFIGVTFVAVCVSTYITFFQKLIASLFVLALASFYFILPHWGFKIDREKRIHDLDLIIQWG